MTASRSTRNCSKKSKMVAWRGKRKKQGERREKEGREEGRQAGKRERKMEREKEEQQGRQREEGRMEWEGKKIRKKRRKGRRFGHTGHNHKQERRGEIKEPESTREETDSWSLYRVLCG